MSMEKLLNYEVEWAAGKLMLRSWNKFDFFDIIFWARISRILVHISRTNHDERKTCSVEILLDCENEGATRLKKVD